MPPVILPAFSLGDVYTEELRNLLGNRCQDNPAIALGLTASKVKTVNAISYTVDGQIFSKAATDDLFVHTDLTVQAADTSKWYALCLDKTGTASIVPGLPTRLPKLPSTLTIIGAIKIVTVGVTFIPATTLNNAAGITVTYFNISAVPTAGFPA